LSDQSWTEPGAYPVADGVHRIPLPLPTDGLRAVNVYVLETDDGLVLVDGGWAIPESRAQFDLSLKEIGYTVADIRRFLVTHMHRDHYTQAVAVRREVGSHVVLGIGDKATLDLMHDDATNEDPNAARLRAAGAEVLAEGWRALMQNRPPIDDFGYPDEWLERDGVIEVGARTLDAVSTPGHTQGHFVFADRTAGLLFAETTCSRRSRRRSGSSRRTCGSRCATSSGPWPRCGRCPTCCCSRRTGRCRRRRTHGSTSWSSSTTCAWRSRWPRSRGAPPTPGPSPASCRGPGGTAGPRPRPLRRGAGGIRDARPPRAARGAGQLSRTVDDGTVRFGPVTPAPPAVSDGHDDDTPLQH
jgi:glyoxylase-like metal-dependent hydrolase (beta-lactamase superfamily II)